MGFQNKNIRDKDKFQWQTIIPHKVRITRPFWISKYPVTYAQFKMLCPDIIPLAKPIEVIKKNGKVELKSHDWSILLDEYGEDVAMCKVSYEDAVKFMGELTKRFAAKIPKGYVLRLPTEAEFEYALKEGGKTNDHVLRDTGRYDLSMTKLLPNGDRRRHLRFNRAGISEDFAWSLGHCGCKVGMSSPNKWGLYDMLGNVCHWCLDTCPNGEKQDLPEGYFKTVRNDPLFISQVADAAGITTYPSYEGDAASKVLRGVGAREHWLGFRVCLGPDLVTEKAEARKAAAKKLGDPYFMID